MSRKTATETSMTVGDDQRNSAPRIAMHDPTASHFAMLHAGPPFGRIDYGCVPSLYTGGPISMIDTMGAAEFVKRCEALASKHGMRFQPNKLLRDMARTGETFYGRFTAAKAAA